MIGIANMAFSLRSFTVLRLHLFAQTIALGEDVVGKIVNGVGRAHTVHVNHALCQHGNDLFHQDEDDEDEM